MKTMGTTDLGTFPVVKTLEDGDDLNEATFDEMSESLRQRTQRLYSIATTLTGGVSKVKQVASSAALKALPATVGDLCQITSLSGNTLGLYLYVAAPPLDQDLEGMAYNNSLGEPSGVWVRDLFILTKEAGAEGVPRWNEELVRTPNLLVWNALATKITPVSQTYTGGASHYVDTDLSSGSIPVVTGDICTVHYSGALAPTNVTGAGAILTVSLNGGTATEIVASQTRIVLDPLPTSERQIPIAGFAQYVVPSGAVPPGGKTVAFGLRLKVFQDVSVAMYQPWRLHTQIIRP